MAKYQTVIGLEVHVQLATKSKAFCSDDTTFGGSPNEHISVVSLGHPGTLPRLNEQQVWFATRLGLALGCEISLNNRFDRKNYFYSDLPKGYQITQDHAPICIGGSLPIKMGDTWRNIRIHHIHMEEDAGKSIHDQHPRFTYIDLNRAGTPLLEIVTEPDFRSADEVDAFMSGIRQLVRWLEVSDGNMEEGSIRCDCNISLMPIGATEYGQRCEVKNLNSMRFARKAIAYEEVRQAQILDNGGVVSQETMHFDPVSGRTSPIRSKEDAHDYRYFAEPDLPPLVLKADWVQDQKDDLPSLPWDLYEVFTKLYGLSDYDATLLVADRETATYSHALLATSADAKSAANLLINKVLPTVANLEKQWADWTLPVTSLVSFLYLIDSEQISHSIAYQQLFGYMMARPEVAPLDLAKGHQLLLSKDDSAIDQWVEEVLSQHQDKVTAYQKGKKGLMGFFMGELMKKSKGKIDPKQGQAALESVLGK